MGALTVGCSYKLENMSLRSFGGVKYVSVSENATINEVDNIGEISEDVPAMEGRIVTGEIVHVEKCEKYNSCRTCKAKVVKVNESIGKCSKCDAKMKFAKNCESITARFVIVDHEGQEHKVTAFDEIVKEISNGQMGDDIEEKLLSAPVMIFTVNNRDIVCAVSHTITTV